MGRLEHYDTKLFYKRAWVFEEKRGKKKKKMERKGKDERKKGDNAVAKQNLNRLKAPR